MAIAGVAAGNLEAVRQPMRRLLPLSTRFSHIVLPREVRRPQAINLAVVPPERLREKDVERDLSLEESSFLRWLFGQAGLECRHYRTETLERRLPACLRVLRAASAWQARRTLESNPRLLPAALSAMLVGVTSFFRDPPLFDVLRKEVLPGLAKSRSGLYVWSAGCSEGAELYTVAILLAELGLLSGSYLLGTDCRPDVIERAKHGRFDDMALKNLCVPLKERYFLRKGSEWQMAPALREATRWRAADLMKSPEPGFWDLILFRNTAIYLRAEAAGLLWERFEKSLRPLGVLVLGKAERPVGAKKLSLIAPCIYRRERG
jgi:chemotaxis protein methyltransferase CheR